MLKKREEQLKSIQWKLNEIFDLQKSYVDIKRIQEFSMEHKFFLWVRPIKSIIKSIELDPQFVGPFEIVKKKSPVAYKLSLPPILSKMYDIFHVSLLRKSIFGPLHILDFSELQMLEPQDVKVIPIKSLAFKIRKLRSREIDECLVQWDKFYESFSTWEYTYVMNRKIPYLFE